MRIAVTDEHVESWAENPPQKRLIVSDIRTPGLAAWREPSGVISFRFRYVSPINRKRKTITIGRHPATSLNEARIKALELAEAVQKGADPKLENSGVTTSLTLKELLLQMVESEAALFRRTKGAQGLAPRTASDYEGYCRRHYGEVGELPVDYLQRHPHVIAAHISAISGRGTENQARLTKASMSSAFSWGILNGLIVVPINPCISQYRVRRKKSAGRSVKRFLTVEELKHLLLALDGEVAGKAVSIKRRQAAVAAMVKLMLYTGCRPGEAAGVFRDEFDLAAGTWTLPGFRAYRWNDEERIRRTKNGKTHVIPLPHQAVKLVAEVIEAGPYSPWLFPVRKFAGLPKTPHMRPPKGVLGRVFKDCPGDPVAPHALRRTTATQLEEQGFADRQLVSRVLNHSDQSVAGKHYLGGQGIQQMRKALQRWADFLDRLKAGGGEVVDIERFRRRAG
jgi:integrase